jgi:hypothetical protein
MIEMQKQIGVNKGERKSIIVCPLKNVIDPTPYK